MNVYLIKRVNDLLHSYNKELLSDNYWTDADGTKTTFKHMLSMIEDYVKCGKSIYVGSDSMRYTAKCIFVTAICLHDNENRRSHYFYSRHKTDPGSFCDLRSRIFKEVEDSLEVGAMLNDLISEASIEIHIDIGKGKKSRTRKYFDTVSGWVKSLGFVFKTKPNSWASSSVADWHTKRIAVHAGGER